MSFKYFGEWDADGVEVRDLGLKRYIRLDPTMVPHGGGRHSDKQFGKSRATIVERLMAKFMRSGSGTSKIRGKVIRGTGACGKKHKAYNIVKKAFRLISDRTKKNPLQVLVGAIQNAAPREETTRISYGGITYYLAVDSAPQRRLDIAIKNIVAGAFSSSFSNKKSIDECLAEEIILAASNDTKSYAVSRKEEIERIAKGAR